MQTETHTEEQTVSLTEIGETFSVKRGIYARYIKRPLDVVLSLAALVVLSPLLLVIAILVRLKLGSPVIFRQERPGKDEKIFTLYKFRTMTEQQDPDGALLPDSERLTRFGRFLRSTSIDELPELYNILKGDMSIVGPRPLLVQYLPLYNEQQKRRHEVRPGLSGLAQVSGRNAMDWEEKFNIDIAYVQRITFLGDIRIVCKTIGIVVLRKGVSNGTCETSELFTGNKSPGIGAEETVNV